MAISHAVQPTELQAVSGQRQCACRGGFYVQYECLEKLGEGAFGEALKARRRKVGLMLVAAAATSLLHACGDHAG